MRSIQKSPRALAASLVCFISLGAVAHAGFTNGSFETGDFTGWTLDGGTWYGDGTGQHITWSGAGRSAVVTSSPDVRTGGVMPSVPTPQATFGNFGARVNDAYSGAVGGAPSGSGFISSLSQTATWTDSQLNFAWAFVLQDPGHAEVDQPFFEVKVTDITTSSVLYDVNYTVSGYGASTGKPVYLSSYYDPGTTTSAGQDWKYTDWNIEHLNTSNYIGDQLQVQVIAAGCGLGGHAGYVYVDGFTAGDITVDPSVPEPSTWAGLAVALGGLAQIANRRRSSAK